MWRPQNRTVWESYLVRPRSVWYCLAWRAAWGLSKRPVLWHVGWWVARVLGTPKIFPILLPGLWLSRHLRLFLFTSCVTPKELWEDGSLRAPPWALFLFGITRGLMTDASLGVCLCSLRKMGEAFSRAWGTRCPGRDPAQRQKPASSGSLEGRRQSRGFLRKPGQQRLGPL